MSKTKRFLEDVSVRHGHDGEINDEVLEIAKQEMAKALNKSIFIDHTIRMDGRVELVCNCGVGHPSYNLTIKHRGHWQDDLDGIHGCCGCCWNTEAFIEAENRFSKKSERMK